MLEAAYLYRSIQLYHFVVLMFDFFLCDVLFTEKNAANSVVITANVCRQHVHHGSSAEYDGARWQSRQVELSGGSVSEQRDLRVAARRQRRTGVQSYDSLRRRQPRLRVGRRRRRRLVHVQTDERARIDAGSQSLSQCHL